MKIGVWGYEGKRDSGGCLYQSYWVCGPEALMGGSDWDYRVHKGKGIGCVYSRLRCILHCDAAAIVERAVLSRTQLRQMSYDVCYCKKDIVDICISCDFDIQV